MGFGTFEIATGDFNSDGKLDLAATKSSGGVAILLGNGDGTFQAAQSFPGASVTYSILIGNYNQTGGLAVATTDFISNKLDVLLQTVSVSPSSINFGSQPVGQTSSAQNFTITNSTSQLVNFSGITFTGTNSTDFAEIDNCGSSLVSGALCTVQVTFTAGAVGSRTASLSIADDAPGSPQVAAVSGTGTAAAAVGLTANTIAFPNQTVGTTSASQQITLTNTGNVTLNISSISVSGTNAADFQSTNNCGASVAAGANCVITATFAPSAAGTRSGTIIITDNAADSPESIALSGTAQALDFSLSLSSATPTVTSGNSANLQLTVTPIGGFSQVITLTCTGAPVNAACVLSPTSITPNGTPVIVSVTLTTAAQTTPMRRIAPFSMPPFSVAGLSLIVMLSLAGTLPIWRRKLRLARPSVWILGGVVVVALGLTACAGIVNLPPPTLPVTPVGNYTLTITATAGSVTHSSTVTLTVM